MEMNNYLELRARVEALEGLHRAVVDLNESFNLDSLVARVEALEATQHAHADVSRLSDAEREQFYAEMARPARVEALEAAANSSAGLTSSAPSVSLVDRMADAIVEEATSAGIVNDRPARAAIREVAEWMAGHTDYEGAAYWAMRLDQEADR